ncbi:MAG: biotin transporter BioY [Synergistales bacterium]|nr:biotin transporter BioY [Synergistales bacterium]
MNQRLRLMILASLFAVLTVVGAYIRIPFPVVPLTLQVFFVYLAGVLLGAKGGLLSQLLYIAMGLLGLPVFTVGGGLQAILRPTFGFIVGFAAMAYVTGALSERKSDPRFHDYFLACLAGMACLYVVGVTGLYLNLNWVVGKEVSLMGAVKIGALPFLPGDLLKAVGAAALALRVGRPIRQMLRADRAIKG